MWPLELVWGVDCSASKEIASFRSSKNASCMCMSAFANLKYVLELSEIFLSCRSLRAHEIGDHRYTYKLIPSEKREHKCFKSSLAL